MKIGGASARQIALDTYDEKLRVIRTSGSFQTVASERLSVKAKTFNYSR